VHVVSVQLPSPQLLAAFACEQVEPHLPQFVSVWMFVSQPLPKESSQLSKPALQVGSQVPAALQLTEALATLPQLTPHAPQFATVRKSVSHITLSPLQSAVPASHWSELHVPLLQYGLSLGQLVPQAPQFAGELRSVSQPSPPPG
jgi:hypothetical protein